MAKNLIKTLILLVGIFISTHVSAQVTGLSTKTSIANGTSTSAIIPSDQAAGNLMLYHLVLAKCSGNPIIKWPTGFNQIRQDGISGGEISQGVAWKAFTPTDGTPGTTSLPVSWTGAGNCYYQGFLGTILNSIGPDGIGVGGITTSPSTTFTIPVLPTTVPGELIVDFWGQDGPTSIIPNNWNTDIGHGISISDYTGPTPAGNTPTLIGSSSGSNIWAAAQIGFLPIPTPTPTPLPPTPTPQPTPTPCGITCTGNNQNGGACISNCSVVAPGFEIFPTPQPTPTPTPTPLPPTPTPSPTPTPVPPTPTPTITPTPSPTPTPIPSPTPTPLTVTFLDNTPNGNAPTCNGQSGTLNVHLALFNLSEPNPTSVTITGTGVSVDKWVSPCNGVNAQPLVQLASGAANADVWFSFIQHAATYMVTVTYADGTSQNSDPIIIDPFQPQCGSPTCNAGIPITGLNTDIYGQSRPNPPSIGAVECPTNCP